MRSPTRHTTCVGVDARSLVGLLVAHNLPPGCLWTVVADSESALFSEHQPLAPKIAGSRKLQE